MILNDCYINTGQCKDLRRDENELTYCTCSWSTLKPTLLRPNKKPELTMSSKNFIGFRGACHMVYLFALLVVRCVYILPLFITLHLFVESASLDCLFWIGTGFLWFGPFSTFGRASSRWLGVVYLVPDSGRFRNSPPLLTNWLLLKTSKWQHWRLNTQSNEIIPDLGPRIVKPKPNRAWPIEKWERTVWTGSPDDDGGIGACD